MTKTFKLSVIFFISTLFLVLMRIIFSFSNLSDNVSGWLFSFAVQVVGMGLIPLLLYKFWVKDDILTGLYIKTKIPTKIFGLAIVIGFLFRYLTVGVSVIYQVIIRLLGFTHINSAGTIYSGPEVLIMDILCTAILPAIFEEITDRGITMRLFNDVKEDKMKIIFMAILFALAHQNIVQTGYTFAGGLVIAYLAVKTKSILPGVIVHFMNNFFSVISGYSGQHNGLFAFYENKLFQLINDYFLLAVISFIVCGVVLVMLLRYIADIMKKSSSDAARKELSQPENFHTYTPNGSNLEQLNDLFGFSTPKNAIKIRSKWYEYAFLYGAIALGLLTTLFTFLWGLWR